MSDVPYIVELTEQNMNEVLQQSATTPVLIDIWADWCGPCKALMPILEKLAHEYAGAFILAKLNADEQQAIAGQLGVRSLPTLKLVAQGGLAGELVGAQPEQSIRDLLAPYLGEAPAGETIDGADAFLSQVTRLAEQDPAQAVAVLDEALAEDKDNAAYGLKKAELMLLTEQYDDAEAVLKALPDETEGKAEIEGRLFFARQLAELPTLEAVRPEVQRARAGETISVEMQYAAGVHAVTAGDFDSALAFFMDVLSTDRSYKDDIGRVALVKVFELLGNDNPQVMQYRRRMFTLMH